MNFASSAIGAVFGGLSGVQSGFFSEGITGALVGKAAEGGGQTIMRIASTGLQNLTSGTANSILGAVSYNLKSHLHYTYEGISN
jgi:hypothetical protein